MRSPSERVIVHHLYTRRDDLVPMCGVTPGPGDPTLGQGHMWHTGHDQMMLRAHHDIGSRCCARCLEFALTLISELPFTDA